MLDFDAYGASCPAGTGRDGAPPMDCESAGGEAVQAGSAKARIRTWESSGGGRSATLCARFEDDDFLVSLHVARGSTIDPVATLRQARFELLPPERRKTYLLFSDDLQVKFPQTGERRVGHTIHAALPALTPGIRARFEQARESLARSPAKKQATDQVLVLDFQPPGREDELYGIVAYGPDGKVRGAVAAWVYYSTCDFRIEGLVVHEECEGGEGGESWKSRTVYDFDRGRAESTLLEVSQVE